MVAPVYAATVVAVEFEATPADMSAFQKFVVADIRKAARTPAYYRTLVFLIVVVAILVSGIVDVTLHAPTVVVVLALFAVFWTLIARMYRRAAAPMKDGSLVGPRRIEIDDEGLRQIAPLHETRTKWEGVLSITETPTHLFLMTDRLAGYIVPRRAFRDSARYLEFVRFARVHARAAD